MLWPPQDTTDWEPAPGPDACACATPACRSGWQWQPPAAPSGAVHDQSIPTPLADRDHAEYHAEAGG
jgi:hypothetical protein